MSSTRVHSPSRIPRKVSRLRALSPPPLEKQVSLHLTTQCHHLVVSRPTSPTNPEYIHSNISNKRYAERSPKPPRQRKQHNHQSINIDTMTSIEKQSPIIISPHPIKSHVPLLYDEKYQQNHHHSKQNTSIGQSPKSVMDDVSNRPYCMRSPKPLTVISKTVKSPPQSPKLESSISISTPYLYAHQQPISDLDQLDLDANARAKSHPMSRIKSGEAINHAFRAASGIVGLFRPTSPKMDQQKRSLSTTMMMMNSTATLANPFTNTSTLTSTFIRPSSPDPGQLQNLMSVLDRATSPKHQQVSIISPPPRPMSPPVQPTTSVSPAISEHFTRRFTRSDSMELRKRLQDAANQPNFILSEDAIDEENWVYVDDDMATISTSSTITSVNNNGSVINILRNVFTSPNSNSNSHAINITAKSTPVPTQSPNGMSLSLYESFPQIQEEEDGE